MSVYSALLVGARVPASSSGSRRRRGSIACGRASATHTSLLGVMLGVHPQAARPAGGRRQRAPARLVGALPARPRDRLPRPLRARARSSPRTGAPRSAWSPGGRSTRRRARSGGVDPDLYDGPGRRRRRRRRCRRARSASCSSGRCCRGRRRRATSGCPSARSRRSATSGSTRVTPRRLDDDGQPAGSSTGSRTGSGAAARTSPRPTSRRVLLGHPAHRRGGGRRRAGRRGGRRGRDQGRAWSPRRAPRSTPSRSGPGATRGCPTSPSRATSRSCRELPKTPTAKVRKNELREAGVTPGDERPRAGAQRRWPAASRTRRRDARPPPAQTARPATGITAHDRLDELGVRRTGGPRPPGVDLDERGLVLGGVDRAEKQLDELRLQRPLAQHAAVQQRVALECRRRRARRGAPPARGVAAEVALGSRPAAASASKLPPRRRPAGRAVVGEERGDEPAGHLVPAGEAERGRGRPGLLRRHAGVAGAADGPCAATRHARVRPRPPR